MAFTHCLLVILGACAGPAGVGGGRGFEEVTAGLGGSDAGVQGESADFVDGLGQAIGIRGAGLPLLEPVEEGGFGFISELVELDELRSDGLEVGEGIECSRGVFLEEDDFADLVEICGVEIGLIALGFMARFDAKGDDKGELCFEGGLGVFTLLVGELDEVEPGSSSA